MVAQGWLQDWLLQGSLRRGRTGAVWVRPRRYGTWMAQQIPRRGSSPADVLEALEAHRPGDLDWKHGRAFSLAYYAGDEAYGLATESYARFSSENSLNMDAFPSLRQIQADVFSIVGHLLGGDDKTVGAFTSGGTESILTAIHGARNWGRARNITSPTMVLPTTAHAAFSKAAEYFDVTAIRVPVGADYRADPDAMAAAITADTVIVVASAPSYPQGVIDPIAAVGVIAQEHDVLFHVDACMGFTLPWLERLGHVTQPWNFAVPGVTSMSCDLHKFGYAAKGASVLLHRDKAVRKHQFFMTNDWLGGIYGSPAILGTRSGGGAASTWAMLHHLGEEGYTELAAAAFDARQRLQAGIESIAGLVVRGTPEATLVAFGAEVDSAGTPSCDIFAVADQLWKESGWYLDRQMPPDSLHCTVNAVHAGTVDAFVTDLRNTVELVTGNSDVVGDRTKAYGTVE
jgi:sphinganine-1-phosphate aldolase